MPLWRALNLAELIWSELMGRLHWRCMQDHARTAKAGQIRAVKTDARTLLGPVSAPPASRLTLQLHSMPCKAMLVLRSLQPQVAQASWISKLCPERQSCSIKRQLQESSVESPQSFWSFSHFSLQYCTVKWCEGFAADFGVCRLD